MQDVRQTKEWGKYLQAMGWQVEKGYGEVQVYIKRLTPLPVAILKLQRVKYETIDFEWLRTVGKKYRVAKTYLELDELADKEKDLTPLLKTHGFSLSRGPMLPSKTLVVDLKIPEELLINGMKAKTRYNLNVARRNKLSSMVLPGESVSKKPEQWDELINLIVKSSRQQRLWEVTKKRLGNLITAFGENMYGILIHEERGMRYEVREKPVLAGAIFLQSKEAVFYSYSGSTDEGKKLMAPTLCLWQGMMEGKRRGKKNLDMDGINDERFPKKAWQGFSRFKTGFGGTNKTFVPMYSQWLTFR